MRDCILAKGSSPKLLGDDNFFATRDAGEGRAHASRAASHQHASGDYASLATSTILG
jgi:hypothetical protein